MTIINIRGTSGCGKSTVVRALMGDNAEPLPNEKGRVENYRIPGVDGKPDTYIIGRYETACGGCDGVKTQNEICNRVRHFSKLGNVVFEGLLISHLHSRYRDLARELGEEDFVFLFLDTPLEVCLDRVRARREARGNMKPLNPKNTTDKWNDMRRVSQKLIDDKLRVEWIDYTSPFWRARELLGL